MIDKLLIFLESGLLLFKKNFKDPLFDEQDDLVTGFFSAFLHYLSDQQLGIINSIKTDKKFIQMQKVQNLYIAMIGSILECKSNDRNMDYDRTSHYNSMIENFAHNLLNDINRIVFNHLNKKSASNGLEWPDFSFFEEIENKIGICLEQCIQKIDIIKKISQIKKRPLKQIYKNLD